MEDQTEIPATTTMINQPHIAVCSASGMGHLSPFLSLASALSSSPYNCTVTLVVTFPLITSAESDEISSFFSSHPDIHRLDFPVTPSSPTSSVDPFFSRYDAITRSAHTLTPLLSSLSPPLSAAFSDFFFTAGLNSTVPRLPLPFPNYTITTNSARYFSLVAYLPHLAPSDNEIKISGLDVPFPIKHIPPFDHIYTSLIVANSSYFPLSSGILVNTFDSLEPETLSALNSGLVVPDLPPVFAVGPFHDTLENDHDGVLSWLDEQPEKSVLYVSFGNRSAMSRAQIKELGMGLERSGWRFLWVVKISVVDKEESEELEEVFGEELYEKLCKKGKVVKQWVRQKEILKHEAVGGFLTHCGWNSVVEAADCGVPILAWPMHGEQRENARVAEKAGLGVWVRDWGWGVYGEKVVEAAEIAEKVELLMGTEELRETARRIGEASRLACQAGGSSRTALMSLVGSLKCS